MNRYIDFKQLQLLTSAHFKEIIREPGIIFWGMVFPLLMSLGLGIAFTKKPNLVRKVDVVCTNVSPSGNKYLRSKLVLLNSEKALKILSADSSKYVFTFFNKKLGNTSFVFTETNWQNAIEDLKRGKVNLIINQRNDSLIYHFDPLNSDAQISYNMLFALTENKSNVITDNSYTISPLTLPGSRYIDFLIPGLVAMGIMMSTMWGISYGMIEKRSKKLLRRFVATPMKKSYFLFSLIMVRLLMNFIEASLLVIFACLVFKITIQGSMLALILIFLAGNLAFSGIAILMSARTSKTEIGNGLINIVVMPMMLLSGIFFSYHNFPDKIASIIEKLPLTLLADSIRSIFIEGAGFSQVVIPFSILSLIGLLFFSAGLKFFKWY
jgi:ABC-2 type transport system permease protein